jgi:TRAP-type C4-dicarboxylate transport system permease small subunit
MRSILNFIYKTGGAFSALCIAFIAVLVCVQVGLNLVDRLASIIQGRAIGLTVPSYSDFTGFLLAAATFMGLAYTLRVGGHIRVTLITQNLADGPRRYCEAAVLLIALALTMYAAVYSGLLVLESYEFGDRSSGIVSVPLWVPQLPVAIGLGVLALAVADELVCNLMGLPASYDSTDPSLTGE